MSNEPTTDPPGDQLIAILSELTSAIERMAELVLSDLRLTAQNDWDAAKAVREATVVAAEGARAARAAEAAVNVWAEQSGKLTANIEILTHLVKQALSRVSGLEMVHFEGEELRARKPGGNGDEGRP